MLRARARGREVVDVRAADRLAQPGRRLSAERREVRPVDAQEGVGEAVAANQVPVRRQTHQGHVPRPLAQRPEQRQGQHEVAEPPGADQYGAVHGQSIDCTV